MLPACMCACFYVHLLRCFSLDILSNLWVCVGESYLAVVDDEEMTTGRVVKSLSKRLVETVYTDSPVGVLLRSQPFPRVCYQLQIYCIKQREIRSRISFTRFIVGRSNYLLDRRGANGSGSASFRRVYCYTYSFTYS